VLFIVDLLLLLSPQKERNKKMTNKRRIVWTVLLCAAFTVFSMAWNAAAPVYEVDAALGQMENSDEAYTIGRTIASWDPVFWAGVWVIVLGLFIWIPAMLQGFKELSEETKANA
jgi:hypothetical protein